MSKQKFIKAMGYVDDRILERYMKEEDRLAAPRIKKWGLVVAAACLLLVATVVSLLLPPYYKTSPYSVQEIADLLGVYDGTSSYEKVTVPDSSYLNLYNLPKQNYLPIYSFDTDGSKLNTSKLEQFITPIYKRLTGTRPTAYETKEPEWTLIGPYLYAYIENETLQTSASQTKYYHYFNFSAKAGDQLELDGEPVQVDCRQDDEAILESLSGIKKSLFEIFSVSFTHAKVERSGRIRVYFYNENAHPLNKTFASWKTQTTNEPVSDYICISFQMNGIVLRDATIEYREARQTVRSQYDVTAKVKRLTLEEAEAHLYQGYVFAMSACPICTSRQEEVSFENYDYVSFEYIFGRHSEYLNVPTTGIPYYVFYKQIGTDKQGNLIYAKTYVLAIHVDGLAEYFEAQHTKHAS